MDELIERRDGATRRSWLKTATAATAVLASGETKSEASEAGQGGASERPNIILIISDQFRWDCVGAMGLNPMNLTPNLDAMARKGVLFRSAICNQPVCAPTRASMFTGQYPSRHGVWKNGLGLATNANTIATAMRGDGYTANYIGKWHLQARIAEASEEHPTLTPCEFPYC